MPSGQNNTILDGWDQTQCRVRVNNKYPQMLERERKRERGRRCVWTWGYLNYMCNITLLLHEGFPRSNVSICLTQTHLCLHGSMSNVKPFYSIMYNHIKWFIICFWKHCRNGEFVKRIKHIITISLQ